jgi:hypothetical protein
MEESLTYDDMRENTGFTIRYEPREGGTILLRAESIGTPIEATLSQKRIDEAHILWMEATELLRSRNKLGQTNGQIRAALEVLFAMFRGEKVPAARIAAVNVPRVSSPSSLPVDKPIEVDGTTYHRLLVKTRFISTGDTDMLPLIEEYAAPHLKPGDTLYVSEKALTITQGGVLDMSDIKPSRLAYFFARNVGNNYGTDEFKGFGHGTPLAMQLLIEEAGYLRALFAGAVAAVTRPLGIRGLFYFICGTQAKSVDLPMSFLILEYAHSAKLAPKHPTAAAKRIKAKLGCDVVILDSNYRGAFSLGKSSRTISEAFIGKLFRDNPMGQSDEMTPFCIVRTSE